LVRAQRDRTANPMQRIARRREGQSRLGANVGYDVTAGYGVGARVGYGVGERVVGYGVGERVGRRVVGAFDGISVGGVGANNASYSYSGSYHPS
jgi:hypothetical protein